MTDASVAAFIGAVENLHAHAPTVGGGLAFDSYGGAINRVASDATAFVHRDKLACIQATYSWSGDTSPSVIAAGAQWLTWLGANVFDPATGRVPELHRSDARDSGRAPTTDRTCRDWSSIKNTYDPDDRFSFAQSIPLTL